ncbi:GtrA family protein [Candidatus Pacearchaeota archaeon]|nr:GtrA family protein [Candidatus Pacearchaeota archaeon]
MSYFKSIKRFVGYNVAAGIASLFDIFILWFLTEFAGIFYLISATISFIIGTSVNYIISRVWVFKGTKARLFGGFISFALVGISSLILTILLMAFLVEITGIYYLIARIISLVITVFWSYTLVSLITFKQPLLK